MLSMTRNWTLTFATALFAVILAAAGLGLSAFSATASPTLTTALLAGSLACTALAFARVSLRVRRLELENEGLIEEISQEFDRVRDKLEIFSESLQSPRTLSPEEAAAAEQADVRRVVVK